MSRFVRRMQAVRRTTSPSGGPDYPTAATTGVPAGTTLTTINGDLIVSTPQTISGKRITGTVDIRANNVVIQNCQIDGSVVNWNGATGYSFTVQDCLVGVAGGFNTNFAIGMDNFTARRVHIQGFSDGFRLGGNAGPILIEDCFVELASNNSNNHSDGVQAYGFAGGTAVINHNTIDQRAVPNDQQTAPIFVPGESNQGNSGITTTITNNLLAGGGYALRAYGGHFPAITGNKIVNNTWQFGPLDLDPTNAPIDSWFGNATVTYDWINGKIISEVSQLSM